MIVGRKTDQAALGATWTIYVVRSVRVASIETSKEDSLHPPKVFCKRGRLHSANGLYCLADGI